MLSNISFLQLIRTDQGFKGIAPRAFDEDWPALRFRQSKEGQNKRKVKFSSIFQWKF